MNVTERIPRSVVEKMAVGDPDAVRQSLAEQVLDLEEEVEELRLAGPVIRMRRSEARALIYSLQAGLQAATEHDADHDRRDSISVTPAQLLGAPVNFQLLPDEGEEE